MQAGVLHRGGVPHGGWGAARERARWCMRESGSAAGRGAWSWPSKVEFGSLPSALHLPCEKKGRHLLAMICETA